MNALKTCFYTSPVQDRPMNDVFTLLNPGITGIKNRIQNKSGNQSPLKFFIMAAIGLIFWGGLFAVSHKVLIYFSSIEDIGLLLSYKLLSMIVAIAFSLFFISSIITSISRLFLSKDLICVHAMPVPTWQVLLSRWMVSFFDSTWMVFLYIVPVLLSYLLVFKKGLFTLLMMGAGIVSLAVTATIAGTVLVVVLVMVIPAGRLKSVFVIFGMVIFCLLYIFARMVKPEQLVDPETFNTVLLYITSLKTPSSPLFPGTWVFDGIKGILEGNLSFGFHNLGLSWSFSIISLLLMLLTADLLYKKGLSKSLGKTERSIKPLPDEKLLKKSPSPTRALVIKELRSFLRDQTQWSQIFLIFALIIIYVYNFTLLPLDRSPIGEFYLQNLLSFLNMGLALFVLTAIAGRFAYPAISMESEAFWIIQSSPVSLSRLLWIKFFIYLAPLFILTQILIVITNLLLHVTPFMMVISIATTTIMVPAVIALAIGIGSIYADFKLENPLKSVTGFGGMVYMISCAILVGSIILLEAGPVYTIFMAGIRNRALAAHEIAWSMFCFTLVPVISLSCIFIPMKLGVRSLNRRWQ